MNWNGIGGRKVEDYTKEGFRCSPQGTGRDEGGIGRDNPSSPAPSDLVLGLVLESSVGDPIRS